jgi:hypothetical protein
MNKNLAAAFVSALATIYPLLAVEEGREQAQDEVLKLVGDIVDCAITSQHIKIESNANTILRIEKNGKETAQFSLMGVRELVVIRCQGSGMGVSPRSESLGEGMQIRVIAKKENGYDVFSVSYTIPDGTEHSVVSQTTNLPTLYSRKDTAGDDRAQLGNLILTLEEKKGEQAGTGQPATRSQSKSEGSEKPQPEAEGRSR